MLVIYKNPNVFSIAPRVDPKDAAVILTEGFDFKPGVNDVPVKLWDEYSKNPLVKRRLDEGKLEAIKGEKGESVDLKDLSKLPEDRAIKVVEQTNDEDVLADLKGLDKRPGVQSAIRKQEKVLADAAEARKG